MRGRRETLSRGLHTYSLRGHIYRINHSHQASSCKFSLAVNPATKCNDTISMRSSAFLFDCVAAKAIASSVIIPQAAEHQQIEERIIQTVLPCEIGVPIPMKEWVIYVVRQAKGARVSAFYKDSSWKALHPALPAFTPSRLEVLGVMKRHCISSLKLSLGQQVADGDGDGPAKSAPVTLQAASIS